MIDRVHISPIDWGRDNRDAKAPAAPDAAQRSAFAALVEGAPAAKADDAGAAPAQKTGDGAPAAPTTCLLSREQSSELLMRGSATARTPEIAPASLTLTEVTRPPKPPSLSPEELQAAIEAANAEKELALQQDKEKLAAMLAQMQATQRP